MPVQKRGKASRKNDSPSAKFRRVLNRQKRRKLKEGLKQNGVGLSKDWEGV